MNVPARGPGDASPPAAPPPPESKVLDRAGLLERFGRPPAGGRRDGRLVFTNGVFDLLHRGHVAYLHAARALGDALVVGVNTDASVHRLKGPARPVIPLEDRMFVLAGLGSVDAVTAFDEDTPRDLIAALRPDLLVKGGDYRPEDVVGAAEVRAAGGDVVILPFIEGRSTTGIIQRLEKRG